MDFNLSEDHIMMRDTARDFAEKRLKPIAEELDARAEMPAELLKETAELGYFGLLAPEEYGGLGVDSLSYALTIEEISKACAAHAITLSVHNSLVIKAIKGFGTEEQKKKYLPKLAAGEIIGAYSLSEPGAGTDAGSLQCRAIRSGDYYVLNGTKSWVSSAGYASVFIVFVLTNPDQGKHGVSCLIVEQGAPGMSLGQSEKKMGLRASDTRELSFIDCKIPVGQLLGEENRGLRVAFSLLDAGRIGVAAQALGIAQAAYDEAVSYARERKQFNQPLINFQATQFKIAEMATRIDAARLLTYRAAVMYDSGVACLKEISMAKLFASQTANFVANEAVQIHGGYGYVKEYPVERYFRDARVTEIYEGTTEAQKMVISRAIINEGQ